QRMFWPGEDADELSEHHLEAPLCVLRRKLGDRRRLSDDVLHLGDETHYQCRALSEGVPQRVAPWRKLCFAFAEQRPDQALKRLSQRRVGDIAFELIAFAGCE